jgi:acyl carrier protein
MTYSEIQILEATENRMDAEEIRAGIKRIIAKVSGINCAEIADSASYVDDLGLDSLSILEIAVNVEHDFKIKEAQDDELSEIRTIEDTVRFVGRRLCVEIA